MKIRHILILGIFLIAPVIAWAEGSTVFQVSLVAPLQWHPADVSVDVRHQRLLDTLM
jgi:hypothetical protein